MNEELRHLATKMAYDFGLSENDTYALLTSTGVGTLEEEWD